MDNLNIPRKNRRFGLYSSRASRNLLISILLLCFFVGFIFMSGCSIVKGVVVAKEIGEGIVKVEVVMIAVYLKDNISDDLKESIEKEIKSWEEVKEVKYISKEQAFERFKEQNEGSDILKEIQGNPIPASFEIKLKSYKKVEQIALRFIDKDGNYIEGVDDVVY